VVQLAKKLVIVESPAKAKTLEKFLGKDFFVKACGGHVRDLPPKRIGVKVDKNFAPTYQIIKNKEKIIDTLKAASKKAKVIFLAPDPDREGEAIAWHLSKVLAGEDKKKKAELEGRIKRIEFNEITKNAVEDAVKHPRKIDHNRVDAQQARRILDRLVGYKISPLLWRKVRKGLSAGRVQSVAVRLICEREAAILKFKPVEYWSITASLTKGEAAQAFPAKLHLRDGEKFQVSNESEANKVLKDLESAQFTVSKVSKRERKRNPSPPFITSTLQQEASRKLGFSAKKTMMIAQRLYEGVELSGEGPVGLITYMRTDSFRIAKEAREEARSFISREYGHKYIPKEPRFYKKKKQAQDAHEAIRPTSIARTPDEIKSAMSHDQFKLYSLIWKRFVATQMASAVLDMTSVDISAANYTFRATGSIIKFDGFITLYVESVDEKSSREKEDSDEGRILPEIFESDILKKLSIIPEQHFTEPPPRFTEASLVKELEQRGIGRPSTYAPILSTIMDRGYVDREGKAFFPTELGKTINGLLVKHFPIVLDFKFTAHMEDDLDDIVAGKIKWVDALKEFYDPFKKNLDKAEVQMKKIKKEIKIDRKCPECGEHLVIRSGRFGDFIACSTYPKCKFTENLNKEDEKKYEGEKCEKCGKPLVLKHSRFGKFLACSGYPECKFTKSILKKIGVACPQCDGDLVVRRSKRKRIFYSCSNYPKCKFSLWDKPVNEKCPKCESLLVEKHTKKEGSYLKCSGKECDFRKQ
jgi:DNA topoisomerase-1